MMRIGRVTANREALVPIFVRASEGTDREVNALLDTGFNGDLALPDHMIDGLGLQRLGREQVTLASGKTPLVGKYEATLDFGGEVHSVEVVEAGAALIGMRLLQGYDLYVHCVAGGRVAIREPSGNE